MFNTKKFTILEIGNECTHQTEYIVERNKEQEELLRKLDGKSVEDFNKWFNDMFEQNKVSDDDFDKGYGDWYKNSEVEQTEKVSSLRDFGRVFENKKKSVNR